MIRCARRFIAAFLAALLVVLSPGMEAARVFAALPRGGGGVENGGGAKSGTPAGGVQTQGPSGTAGGPQSRGSLVPSLGNGALPVVASPNGMERDGSGKSPAVATVVLGGALDVVREALPHIERAVFDYRDLAQSPFVGYLPTPFIPIAGVLRDRDRAPSDGQVVPSDAIHSEIGLRLKRALSRVAAVLNGQTFTDYSPVAGPKLAQRLIAEVGKPGKENLILNLDGYFRLGALPTEIVDALERAIVAGKRITIVSNLENEPQRIFRQALSPEALKETLVIDAYKGKQYQGDNLFPDSIARDEMGERIFAISLQQIKTALGSDASISANGDAGPFHGSYTLELKKGGYYAAMDAVRVLRETLRRPGWTIDVGRMDFTGSTSRIDFSLVTRHSIIARRARHFGLTRRNTIVLSDGALDAHVPAAIPGVRILTSQSVKAPNSLVLPKDFILKALWAAGSKTPSQLSAEAARRKVVWRIAIVALVAVAAAIAAYSIAQLPAGFSNSHSRIEPDPRQGVYFGAIFAWPQTRDLLQRLKAWVSEKKKAVLTAAISFVGTAAAAAGAHYWSQIQTAFSDWAHQIGEFFGPGWSQILGGIVVAGIGIKTFHAHRIRQRAVEESRARKADAVPLTPENLGGRYQLVSTDDQDVVVTMDLNEERAFRARIMLGERQTEIAGRWNFKDGILTGTANGGGLRQIRMNLKGLTLGRLKEGGASATLSIGPRQAFDVQILPISDARGSKPTIPGVYIVFGGAAGSPTMGLRINPDHTYALWFWGRRGSAELGTWSESGLWRKSLILRGADGDTIKIRRDVFDAVGFVDGASAVEWQEDGHAVTLRMSKVSE